MAAERVILQWNMSNWITVVLMASLGTVAIGVVLAGMRQYLDQ